MNPLSPPTHQGYFWMPNNPSVKIPGRFYCTDENRLELEVLGTFSGKPLDWGQNEIARILGIFEDGKLATLENCFYVNRTNHFPGLALSRIHVGLALVGCQFEKDEPICFNEIACYSEAINDWLQFAPIEASAQTSPPANCTLSFVQPEPMIWTLANGSRLKVASSWTVPGGITYREGRITQKTWVSFEFDAGTTLDDLLKYIDRFCHFVSFAVDQAIPLNTVEVYSKDLLQEFDGKKYRTPVQIFYAPKISAAPDLARVVPPFPLFSFNCVKDRFGELISTWLKNYEQFDSSFDLYFATKSGRSLYLENEFLMLMQALESLHRRSSSDTYFPQAEYVKLCDLLRKASPASFKDWLTPRLRYGNEPSLRQRLTKLFGEFESIYGGREKVRALIASVVDTRNYLTHYDIELKSRAVQGEELWNVCLALEILFQLHLALICGFSKQEVIDLTAQSQMFIGKLKQLQVRANAHGVSLPKRE